MVIDLKGGMVYMRGHAADYDAWEALGLRGWNWAAMSQAFHHVEGREEGGTQRGALHVSNHAEPDPVCEHHDPMRHTAWPGGGRRPQPRRCRAGYAQRTIKDGRRWNAASAFLKPARSRPNLQVVTDTVARRIVFEGRHAVGVECTAAGRTLTYRARCEIILSAGALQSPVLLQRSGIGDGALLQSLGIAGVHHSPHVGRRMREHRCLNLQYRLKRDVGYNRELRGWRLARNVLCYLLFRRGPLAGGSYDVGALLKTDPSLARPDVQLLMDSKPAGVTDERLRVRGVSGLRVADCSVMPTIPSGNTNGPVTALAWRAADLILEDIAR